MKPLALVLICSFLFSLSLGQDNSVSTLLKQLEAERFEDREAAHRKLLELSTSQYREILKRVTPYLKDRKASPELRMRSERLASKIFETHQFEEKDGFIGISIGSSAFFEGQDLIRTVSVLHVMPGHMGERAGLEVGDQILEIGGLRFDNVDATGQFMRRIGNAQPGKKVKLTVIRNEQPMDMEVELMKRPGDVPPGLYDRVEDLEKSFDAWLKELKSAP